MSDAGNPLGQVADRNIFVLAARLKNTRPEVPPAKRHGRLPIGCGIPSRPTKCKSENCWKLFA
jgi:hypothetical protein